MHCRECDLFCFNPFLSAMFMRKKEMGICRKKKGVTFSVYSSDKVCEKHVKFIPIEIQPEKNFQKPLDKTFFMCYKSIKQVFQNLTR